MGCFLACFGSSKDGKRRKHVHKVQPRDRRNSVQRSEGSTVSLAEGALVKPINSVSETRDVKEEVEQLSLSTRKRVTFDSNVRTYEHVSVGESQDFSLDKGEKGEEGGVKRSEEEENLVEVKPRQSHSQSEDSSITSSASGSYPPNHRYHSWRESDDELVDYEGSDVDDDDEDDDNLEDDDDDCEDKRIIVDLRYKDASTVEDEVTEVVNGLLPEREVRGNQNARDRSVYVHPVLNPVENLTQWKAVKVKGTAPVMEKENLKLDQEAQISFQSEPSFRELSFSFKEGKSGQFKKSAGGEMSVDTSLSTWLGSSESGRVNKPTTVGLDDAGTPEKSMPSGLNSPGSFDDRPILGALTMEELKQFSATSSPRKSPSRSPDEMPIIGSVGTYWNNSASSKDSGSVSSYKGIPNTTSKYREDKRVNWHSTPFETRLERSLNGGVNKAYSATHGSNVY